MLPMTLKFHIGKFKIWFPLFLIWALLAFFLFIIWKVIIFVSIIFILFGKGKGYIQFWKHSYALLEALKGLSIDIENNSNKEIYIEFI